MHSYLVELIVIAVTLIACPLIKGETNESGQNEREKSGNSLIVISTTSNFFQDNFRRFNQSIQAFDLKLELLQDDSKSISSYQNGMSAIDPKGEMRRQFKLIQEKLSAYKDRKDVVLMLVEGANSILNGGDKEILERFEEFHKSNGTKILFSADLNCWPEVSLAEKYPEPSPAAVEDRKLARQRFLDSRSLIGYATALWEFIELSKDFKGIDQGLIIDKVNYDFQLYSTHVYLSEEHRRRLAIELDERSSLFQNLDTINALPDNAAEQKLALPRVELELFESNETGTNGPHGDRVNLKNLLYNTRPLVVYGNGHAKQKMCGEVVKANTKKLSLAGKTNFKTNSPSGRDSNRVGQTELNSLGNYLGKAWSPDNGCRWCNKSMMSLSGIKDGDMPLVLVAIFIEEPTPFMSGFFGCLRELDYPKSRIHLFIHNTEEYHGVHVNEFIAAHGSKYAGHEVVDFKLLNGTSQSDENELKASPKYPASEWQAREYALLKCKHLGCDYLLNLDSTARLELPESLRALIETNQSIVAPLLSRPGKLWSNFWGAITRDGYYARSADYVDLVARKRVGVWNVPLLMNAYLIEGKFLRSQLEQERKPSPEGNLARVGRSAPNSADLSKLAYYDARYPTIKPALIFARNLRHMNHFQFVTNQRDFGHLVDPTDYNTTLKYPDFYQLVQNKPDWEREYLHENYTDLFDERDEDESNYPDRIRLEQPCQDVYWFPLVSDKFAEQLIDMMEQFGQWSSGKNHDPRIEGGYESVPTRDIHFRQVGLHDMWLFFLREYVMPIQLKEYIGYEHDPPRTDLAFVVRYHPEEQPSLRPHHDSSTYTLNIALNTPGKDYEGGGCRFVRYNCSVTESRKGWALIHPGRLTHYHEGLPVTKGTRYILVTFVDP